MYSFNCNFFYLSKKCLKKGYSCTLLLSIYLSIVFLYSYYKSIKGISQCYKWDITLNQTNINKPNSNSTCDIIIPETCLMKRYYGFFDMSLLMGFNCNNFNYFKARNILLKKLNKNKFKNTLKFGFINTISFGFYQRTPQIFNKNVLDRTIDMDNLNEVKKLKPNEYPEIILEYKDRNYTYAEIKMNITKKKELVEYREKRKNKNSPFENVLFIFFDAISRVHFQRALPKTTKFFEKFMKYNPNSKYKSYHFSKYHSIDGYTRINIQPMFFGYNMKSGRGTYIIRHFKQNGFITAQSMGSCNKESYIFGRRFIKKL